ncbi:MAG TPA: hypothetical protein PKI03_28510 [Pseudomonadota bacterium]|nr:hypothetical protein [Pseudomonadota bacterium]
MGRYSVLSSILCVGLGTGCGSAASSNGLSVLVTVSDVPQKAVYLQERTVLSNGPPLFLESSTELPFDLRATPPSQPGIFTFVLTPQPWSKIAAFLAVVVAVAAFDASGCLVGVGTSSVALGLVPFPVDVSTLTLNVPLRQFPQPDCTGNRTLVLHEVTKGPADLCFGRCAAGSAGSCLCVSGWGFHPKSQLMWNGQKLDPLLNSQWASPVSMIISGVPLPYSGPLRVTNPDGETAELAHVSF